MTEDEIAMLCGGRKAAERQIDIVERLKATGVDLDNFPRMMKETWLPVGLALEAAAEIARLRAEVERLTGWLYRHARRNSLTDPKEWKEIVDYLEQRRAAIAADGK